MLKVINVTYKDTGDDEKNKEIEKNIMAKCVDELHYEAENVHIYVI